MKRLTYPPALLGELKQPLGQMIDVDAEGPKRFLTLLKLASPSLLIAVGDVVAGKLLRLRLDPRVIVVDGRVMRLPTQPQVPAEYLKLELENPAGSITPEAWQVLAKALTLETKVAVVVHGEEDLLALPLIALAPEDAVLVYGQPRQGLVLVKCDAPVKKRVNGLLSRFSEGS